MAAPFLTFRGVGAAAALDDVGPAGVFVAETLRRLAGGDARSLDGVLARPAKRPRIDDAVDETGQNVLEIASLPPKKRRKKRKGARAEATGVPNLPYATRLRARIGVDGFFVPSPLRPPAESPLDAFLDRSAAAPMDWRASTGR